MKVVKGKAQDKLWVKPSAVKKPPFCHRVSPHPHHWSFNVNEDNQAEAMLNAGASAYRSNSGNKNRLLAAIRGEDQ